MSKNNNQRYLPDLMSGTKIMFFVDGENLAIRYGKIIGSDEPQEHVVYEPNVFVWTKYANIRWESYDLIRRYYYTSVQGDDQKLEYVEKKLKDLGIQAPKVFKKIKGKRSKRVDISLATDMLTHAHQKNYDVAVLVAGDEDYAPLIEAVISEGRRVVIWFFQDGLSSALKLKADHYFDIGNFFLNPDMSGYPKYF